MKAYFNSENILVVESETPEERDELHKFAMNGARNGYYHYSSGTSASGTTLWIDVDNKV